jgi:Bromodomain
MASKGKKIPKNLSNLVLNMRDLIEKIKSRQLSHPFLVPVDESRDYAPNYYSIIKKPMCLQDMMVNSHENSKITRTNSRTWSIRNLARYLMTSG